MAFEERYPVTLDNIVLPFRSIVGSRSGPPRPLTVEADLTIQPTEEAKWLKPNVAPNRI
jgi:hypothetical protein